MSCAVLTEVLVDEFLGVFPKKERKNMKDISKYQGIIPAFYACYDDEGNISVERTKELTRYFIK